MQREGHPVVDTWTQKAVLSSIQSPDWITAETRGGHGEGKRGMGRTFKKDKGDKIAFFFFTPSVEPPTVS